MKRMKLTASYLVNGKPYYFTVQGQTAKALKALVEAGAKGVTALEAASWAYRFSAYCHDLIHKHGLNIRTDKEKHPGGWYGRHVLETDVTISDAEDEKKAA
ncbi:winged helix domain-containing protein [Sneathiella aquimaris]|uniref:winged helix domain-containing protein n=1 Tax=Sneathiella aquimaris TaxID=2599305 RepID=UPI00146EFC7F|nr:hypothetical protein [Sneathiella aquimaris]